MLFIIPGFYLLWKKDRSLFQPVFIFLAVNLLLVSSWTGWWYSGSFGMRALMESYVLASIPLAALVAWLGRCITPLRITTGAVMIFFILLNLFQTWQYMNFILPALQKHFTGELSAKHIPAPGMLFIFSPKRIT
jgi:hypothetical protein